VSSSVINTYRKIRPGMSKCTVRIKGSAGIETPDGSRESYNGGPFRKRTIGRSTSRGLTLELTPLGLHYRSDTTAGKLAQKSLLLLQQCPSVSVLIPAAAQEWQ
jgi:hypothetical protein